MITKRTDPWPRGLKIHMVGIGGSGMSSMAHFLQDRGAVVSGSDRYDSPNLEPLRQKGVDLRLATPEGIVLPDGLDLLVYTAAAEEEHGEILAAREHRVETLKYAHMLGRIMDHFTGIAVAGTHGKTSVSALCAYLFKMAGLSPSYVIGGSVPDLEGGGGGGQGSHFIAEACEFDRSFLSLRPDWGVITNIEPDHLDYYGSFKNLVEAFESFIRILADRQGSLVLCDEAVRVLAPLASYGVKSMTYGFDPGSDLVITDHVLSEEGSHFSLAFEGQDLGRFMVKFSGRHNVLNTAAACLTALEAGIDLETLRQALPLFQGVNRRLEERGVFGGIRIISDYAHHPTEIRAVRDTLRMQYPGARLVVAYQGHQRWRNGFFLRDLGQALSGFDLALLLRTFSVREKETRGLPDGELLAETVKACGGASLFVGDLDEAAKAMLPQLKAGDLLVLMGAGTIDEISGIVAKELSLS